MCEVVVLLFIAGQIQLLRKVPPITLLGNHGQAGLAVGAGQTEGTRRNPIKNN
jgi:hypothetical protein